MQSWSGVLMSLIYSINIKKSLKVGAYTFHIYIQMSLVYDHIFRLAFNTVVWYLAFYHMFSMEFWWWSVFSQLIIMSFVNTQTAIKFLREAQLPQMAAFIFNSDTFVIWLIKYCLMPDIANVEKLALIICSQKSSFNDSSCFLSDSLYFPSPSLGAKMLTIWLSSYMLVPGL